ncbi:hypothetical protein JW758_01385 [Candidatus Peregrinibacteria bacterium]|nr:hypothetical protein [Candidatus Peregrinibacteria bacterium]
MGNILHAFLSSRDANLANAVVVIADEKTGDPVAMHEADPNAVKAMFKDVSGLSENGATVLKVTKISEGYVIVSIRRTDTRVISHSLTCEEFDRIGIGLKYDSALVCRYPTYSKRR